MAMLKEIASGTSAATTFAGEITISHRPHTSEDSPEIGG